MNPLVNKFIRSSKGNVALTAALMAFPLMGGAGLVMDYSYLARLQALQQGAVDAAALATAKELGVANVDMDTLQSLAETYVANNLGETVLPADMTVTTSTSADNSGLTVKLEHVWEPMFLHYVNKSALPITTTATANQAGEGTICMLGLATGGKHSIRLKEKAHLNASGCGVYSNSDSSEAISVEDNGKLVTGITCSAGGYHGQKNASFEPKPITDCPLVPDPLAKRQMPTIGSCDYDEFEVSSGFHTLYPGTYCEGLKISGTAEVQLKPGIYIITDEKLEVTEQATMKGEGVGFFLNGDDAKLSLKKETTISLTAPKTGLMAGLLFFEDRNAAPDEWHKHEITSDNARQLLGTVYLPNGTLKIDSEGAIADQSAYTAIIARKIELREGPTLYLNSDYKATDVPVPEGLVKDRVFLAKWALRSLISNHLVRMLPLPIFARSVR